MPAPRHAAGGEFALCLLDNRASQVATVSGFVTVPLPPSLPVGVVVKVVRYLS